MEVKGYPNYLIYDDGRVWSKPRQGARSGFMKSCPTRDGYLHIRLRDGNRQRKNFYVHRLVAQHYIPNPNNYETVDHIDRNILNNHVSNLRCADRDWET